jgi:catechol 2,3-dioxygenase-like lactoylglutathione lyase family enzyme
MIRINVSSIIVNDQEKAERFYCDVLGFVKKRDIPFDGARWLTVENPDGSGVELALEPAGFEFARTYQKALYDNGVPIMSFGSDDLDADYARLVEKGVSFRGPPAQEPGTNVRIALLEDGCGNLVMLAQEIA